MSVSSILRGASKIMPARNHLLTRAMSVAHTQGGSANEFHSVERILEEHLPSEELAQVKRVMYGLNVGTSNDPEPAPQAARYCRGG